MRFPYSPLSFLSITALLAFAVAASVPARAQGALHNDEVSISAFAQLTSDANGNGIKDTTTNSVGGQAAFRHSYKWWLGYEGSYAYTRYAEIYTGQPFSFQHNMHEFAGSYVVRTPVTFLGFRPFATIGVSALVFSPSLNGGQHATWQGRPALNYGVGVNRALLTSHFGVRVQYRALYYKAPDFGNPQLTTDASRTTSEPMIGLYFGF